MARILITTFGSYGDLYPYLAIGQHLRQRGHLVTIGTGAAYRGKAEAEGLSFAAIRPDVELDNREFLKWVFDQRKGSERIVRTMAGLVADTFADTLGPAMETDLIVTHPLSFAAALIAKQRGLPWVSTVLAPISLISAFDPPVLAPIPWLRKAAFLRAGFYKWLYRIARWQTLSWTKPVIHFGRQELGLTSEQIGAPLFDGSHSPQAVLALFSPLFARPQSDWPAAVVTTGFPFFEGAGHGGGLPPEVEEFLRAGHPPVVFTLGSSAVGAAGDFYRASFQAVERLGLRAVFLTGFHPQGLPEPLPRHMLACRYAPHSALFPRASVNVHQGGIGTTAEALRSGRPMLVVPFAHDQFDNAERCRKLGVALWIGRGSYTAGRAEGHLRALLSDATAAARSAEVAKSVRAENGSAAAADTIERLLVHRGLRT